MAQVSGMSPKTYREREFDEEGRASLSDLYLCKEVSAKKKR